MQKKLILSIHITFTWLLVFYGANAQKITKNEWKVEESHFSIIGSKNNYRLGPKIDTYAHTRLVYDKQGNMIEYYALDNKGKSFYTAKLHYNQKGQCDTTRLYMRDNLYGWDISYFEGEKKLKSQFFNKKGKLISTTKEEELNKHTIRTIQYDDQGRLNDESVITKNTRGEVKSVRTVSERGSKIEYEQYTRNKQGDYIKINTKITKIDTLLKKRIDSHKVKTYEYKYDHKGNWIKKIEFTQIGEIKKVVLRNILYYDELDKVFKETDLIGHWIYPNVLDSLNELKWIKFKKDHSFSMGYGTNNSYSGLWKLNSQGETLMLEVFTNYTKEKGYAKNVKVYNFSLKGANLMIKGKSQDFTGYLMKWK